MRARDAERTCFRQADGYERELMDRVRSYFFGSICVAALAVLLSQSVHCIQHAVESHLAIEADCAGCAEHSQRHSHETEQHRCTLHCSLEVLQPTRDSSVDVRFERVLNAVVFDAARVTPFAIVIIKEAVLDPSPPNHGISAVRSAILLC